MTQALQQSPSAAPTSVAPGSADTPAVMQLDSLTALRFFAAASVVVCHTAGILLQVPIDGNIAFSHSVSFFFVLSGFILTYVHPQVNGLKEAVSFWRARFGRIYPAHIFSLSVLMFFCPWSHLTSNVGQLIANVFLLHAWIPHYTFFQCYNLPAWSVSDEMFFYLLFPLLIVNLRKTWFLKLGAALVLAMAVIALPALFKFSTTGLNGLTIFGLYYFFPPARLFEFVLGMSCAVLWNKVRTKNLSTPLATVLEIGTLGTFLAFATNTYTILRPLLSNPNVFWQGLGTWLTVTGNCFTFGALILVFATQKGLIARTIRHQPFVYLGELSYSTYLLHYPIILGVLQLKAKYGLNPIATVAVMLSILIPASAFTFQFVEMPLRKFIVGKKKKTLPVADAMALEVPAAV